MGKTSPEQLKGWRHLGQPAARKLGVVRLKKSRATPRDLVGKTQMQRNLAHNLAINLGPKRTRAVCLCFCSSVWKC